MASTADLPADPDGDGAIDELTPKHTVPRPHPNPQLAMAARNRIEIQSTRTTLFSSYRNYLRDYEPSRFPSEDASDNEVYELMSVPLRVQADALRAAESAADAYLARLVHKYPLYAWSKTVDGLGDTSLALLLGGLEPLSRFANPAKMLQYCGYGDPLRSRRRKGEKAGYNPELKTVCIRMGRAIEKLTPREDRLNRAAYDDVKARYRRRTEHCGKTTCKKTEDGRCSDGHTAAMARRYAVKRILISLWVEWMRECRREALDDHQAHAAPASTTGPIEH